MTHVRSGRIPIVSIILALALLGWASVRPPTRAQLDPSAEAPAVVSAPSLRQTGWASFYGGAFHGRETASGEIFDQNAMTAAHRRLAFGTVVRVTNLANGATVVVTVNDRGPYIRNRLIDLSAGAARALGFVEEGTTRVRVEPIS